MSKILIAGLGSIGRRHLRNLRSLGHTNFILYRSRRSTLPEAELEDIPTETDLQAALARQPAAVIVSNPTSLHLPVAIAAARSGCHLFLEKPISHTLDKLDELTALVEQHRLQVLVGFQFRFHPGLQAVKQLLQRGAIGTPVYAHAHWGEYLPGWHPWEDYRSGYSARSDLGGGVILTLCHPLDYLRWLLGEVKTFSATVGQRSHLELDVEDMADITLEFEEGAIASVHLDYIQQPPTHTLHITGQQGSLRWDNADGAVHWYEAKRGDWQTIEVSAEFERNSMFLAEMQHFLDCLSGKATPLVTLEDGVKGLAIALAAKAAGRGKNLLP
ncbi:MAG: Gfo/Idh/MocA family oxidoreductase [Leptolyngbyaceae cyanobacterium SM1_4_3]|nr:Gfo/Idh/MocA family oxidoreductase [Leptolyngbyaceae cyanobacterium SM1_4_3]